MKTFEEVYEIIPGNGWLSKPEAELLWKWANAVDGDILEVGSYQGRSTVLLALTGQMVYAVDPFRGFDSSDPTGDETCRKFMDNLSSRSLTNVTLHRQRIEEWWIPSHGSGCPIRFAYLDGDHTFNGTVSQIEVAIICGAKVITVHDLAEQGQGAKVKDACLKLLGPWTERVERLGVWDRR